MWIVVGHYEPAYTDGWNVYHPEVWEPYCWSIGYYICLEHEWSCFAAGTPLLTPEGSKPIEQFKAGDLVLSSPEGNPEGPVVPCRVREVIRSRAQLVEIGLGGQVVRASREHPFYVKGNAWVPAASLAAGDLLRSHDGRWLPVESVTDKGEDAPVYNVRVEGYGTYYLGSQDWGFSVWVHDTCGTMTK